MKELDWLAVGASTSLGLTALLVGLAILVSEMGVDAVIPLVGFAIGAFCAFIAFLMAMGMHTPRERPLVRVFPNDF